MSMLFGMIAALPEFGPQWLFRATRPFAALLRRMARDKEAFEDGYDRVADRAAERARHG